MRVFSALVAAFLAISFARAETVIFSWGGCELCPTQDTCTPCSNDWRASMGLNIYEVTGEATDANPYPYELRAAFPAPYSAPQVVTGVSPGHHTYAPKLFYDTIGGDRVECIKFGAIWSVDVAPSALPLPIAPQNPRLN